jgi:hypothetical protein
MSQSGSLGARPAIAVKSRALSLEKSAPS